MALVDIFNKILKEYEDIRYNSQLELNMRKNDVYSTIPRIQEIDNEISQLSIHFSKEILKNPYESETFTKELQKQNMDLKIEKSELLACHKFPTDYLTLKYHCNACSDTGYIDNLKCKCFKQKIIDNLYLQSNLSNLLQNQNFDTFNFSYFSDEIDPKFGKSSKDNIKELSNITLSFINNFNITDENLLFTGSTGVGKTFLSSCIAKELLDKGYTVFYQTAFKIFDILEEYKFSKSKDTFDKTKIDILFNTDLLIIDDLGTEFVNSYTTSEFFNILNSRILNKKKTIISTNLNLNELFDLYSARVASRIWGHYKVLDFFGDDIRQKISVNFN